MQFCSFSEEVTEINKRNKTKILLGKTVKCGEFVNKNSLRELW